MIVAGMDCAHMKGRNDPLILERESIMTKYTIRHLPTLRDVKPRAPRAIPILNGEITQESDEEIIHELVAQEFGFGEFDLEHISIH